MGELNPTQNNLYDQSADPAREAPILPPPRGPEIDDSPKPIEMVYKNGEDAFVAQSTFVDNLIAKEFIPWEAWRKPWEILWNECYKLYLNIVEMIKTPSRARIFIPAVFKVIEAAMPKLMTMVFGNDHFFDVMPDSPSQENMAIAEVIRKLIKFQLNQAQFFVKFMSFVKQLLMYGTSYFYVYWKVVRRWVWKRTAIRGPKTIMGFTVQKNAILGWKEEKIYEAVERRPEIEVLDVLDVYPDPEAHDEHDSKAIWVRSWMDVEQVRELGSGSYPLFDPENVKKIEMGSINTLQESRQVRNSSRGLTTAYIAKNQVELLTRWGLCDLDGDGIREETMIVIANRKWLLKAISNPFHHQRRPIIRAALFSVPNEWFGVGLIEPIIPLQHELNTIRRQRLDNINIIINRMWKVNIYADIDLDTLVSSPNGIILTDDMNAIEDLKTENVTQDAYNEAAAIQNDIDSATVPQSLQGSPSSGSLGRTAKGAQLITGQALEKYGTATKMLEETTLKELLRIIFELDLQFLDTEEDMDPYAQAFEETVAGPDMLRIGVTFQMRGISDLIDKESKIQQLTSFMGIFGPVLDPNSITYIMKQVWTLMDMSPDDVNLKATQPMPSAQAPGGMAGGTPPQAPPPPQVSNLAMEALHNGRVSTTKGVVSQKGK